MTTRPIPAISQIFLLSLTLLSFSGCTCLRCCEGVRGMLFNGTCLEYRTQVTDSAPVLDARGTQYILRQVDKFKETRRYKTDAKADMIEVTFTLLVNSGPAQIWKFQEPVKGTINFSQKEGLVVSFVRESTGEDLGGMIQGPLVR